MSSQSLIQITPSIEWNKWKSNPPPKNTWVLARYPYMAIDKAARVLTCGRGCCVIQHGLTLMHLPEEWLPTDDQSSDISPLYSDVSVHDYWD